MASCEVLVTEALSCPLVKTLIKGLNDAGCSFEPLRNVACEPISGGLAGGYDFNSVYFHEFNDFMYYHLVFSYDLQHNQVVLCSEKCSTLDKVKTILAHELVHMYDNCVRYQSCNEGSPKILWLVKEFII